MERRRYDAIVIGGGPGGYTAGIRLAQLGKRTLVVERESLGGVCLNWGCIPSKALISAAALVERARHAGEMGIGGMEPTVDFARTQAWKDGIVAKLTGSVGSLIRGNGGDVVMGTARLVSPGEVEVALADGGTARFAADAVVVATGARVATLPGFAPDGARILTAREAVSLTEVPASLLVVGGGVIGMELGMMYQRLGTRVTVVEFTDALLPGIDADLVRVVERRFRARGGVVMTGARAESWEERGGLAAVTVARGEERVVVEAERVLVSVGFAPNTAGLGLAEAGVALDARGHVRVDAQMRTNVPGVYAVGDVSGPPYLAHKGFKEGEIVADVIAGRTVFRDWVAMPAAVFTDPEIATVGLSEAEAKARGLAYRVGRFPFSALGRAMSLGETDGFIKVLADDDRILGVHVVGPEASEMIGEAGLALEMMAAAEDVALTVHAHPTLSEGLHESFKHLLGEAVHVMNRPRRPAAAAVA